MATVRGIRQVQAALRRVEKQVEAASRLSVVQGASLLEAAAKGNFEGSHKRGEPHVGGNKPNIVTGHLRRSIRQGLAVRLGFASWAVRVGPTAIYSRRVELDYGYAYFMPAVRSTAPKLAAIARANWTAAIIRR